MKKLVLVFAAFAIAAAGAFSVDFNGQVFGMVNIAEGDSVKDSEIGASGTMGRIRFNAAGRNEAGTFGAQVRLNAGSAIHEKQEVKATGYGWWKPGDMFWLAVGRHPGSFFARDDVVAWDGDDATKKVDASHPIAVGVGVSHASGDFGLRFRTIASFGGNEWEAVTDKDGKSVQPLTYEKSGSPFGILVDVLPSFAMNEKVTAFSSLGIAFTGATKVDGDAPDIPSAFGWHFNPYAEIGVSSVTSFFAGFRLWSDGGLNTPLDKNGARDPVVNWAIPVGINVKF